MPLRPYQNDLVENVRKAWKKGYKAPCIVLGCGGGKSCIVAEIAKKTTENGKRVLFLVHRKELVEQITDTFQKWGVVMDLCDIGMVQTYTRHLDRLSKPSLIITDENHHSLATTYKRIYDYFSDVMRVGVTATPTRLDGSGLKDVNDILIVGVSTSWLIEHQCLSPYDYYAPSVTDLTGLRTQNGEYMVADIEKKMIKNTVFGDVIRYYKTYADGKKAICYCASIKHSQRMATAFCQAGIKAVHIDGNTPKDQRTTIISDFRKGNIRILCNVDLISEGFDVPDCECSILLRPTKSLTLYIQQSMRCMRYQPNKRAIILDHVGNYSRHGLPDQDRIWSLDAKKKTVRKKDNTEDTPSVKQCPQCFYTFPISKNIQICPNCGFVFPNKRNIKEEDKAQLIRIGSFHLDFSRPDDCQTYKDLLNYAEKHGYKKGWAYYQAKKRGFIR